MPAILLNNTHTEEKFVNRTIGTLESVVVSKDSDNRNSKLPLFTATSILHLIRKLVEWYNVVNDYILCSHPLKYACFRAQDHKTEYKMPGLPENSIPVFSALGTIKPSVYSKYKVN